MEREERQTEKTTSERAEVEAEVEADQREEEKDKRDSLPESLRMTSWVEVENERRSGGAEVAAKAEALERGDGAERPVLLPELEGRRLGEAEKAQTRSVEEELAMMEEKWRQQCAINETLKQRLADEEERFRVRRTNVNPGGRYNTNSMVQ